MINETYPTIMEQLYGGTWIHYNPLPFLEDNNITETLKNVGLGVEWFTSEGKNCTTSSSAFLNVDECYFYN